MAKTGSLKKGAGLQASVHAAAGKQPGPVAVAPKQAPATAIIQAHFAPEVRQALRQVMAKTPKNIKQLLGEGINYVCHKYGVPEPYSEEA